MQGFDATEGCLVTFGVTGETTIGVQFILAGPFTAAGARGALRHEGATLADSDPGWAMLIAAIELIPDLAQPAEPGDVVCWVHPTGPRRMAMLTVRNEPIYVARAAADGGDA